MKLILSLYIFFFLTSSLIAQDQSTTTLSRDLKNTASKTITTNEDDTIYVIGSKEKAFYTPGSAHFVDQKTIAKFNYSDINRVLDKVPGVYLQEEDGLGLRPNIGLRGAHPHRSRKVTLMEDGILMGPAPYSAPAAYYFPLTSRVNSLEVFKGPSAVKYGPNSIGGAINMVTPQVGGKKESYVDFSGGSKTDLLIRNNGQDGRLSWFVQANRRQGDLLKKLPSEKELDFSQNDLLMKFKYKLKAGNSQVLRTKLSFSSENSDETYLGLSDQDFILAPSTRYEASQDDNMQWTRGSAVIGYDFKVGSGVRLSNSIYHHQMRRNWSKFTRLFGSETAFKDALKGDDPNNLVALLKGERNSANANENLVIGTNDRQYYSQGVQSQADFSFETGSFYHDFSVGVRLHRDEIIRNHSEIDAEMFNGELNYIAGTNRATTRTKDNSQAIALFLDNEMTAGNLMLKTGARVEYVSTTSDPREVGDDTKKNKDTLFSPGIGVNYGITDSLVFLAGVNRGLTLVGPGQDDQVQPEEAINYEAGLRLKAPFYFEAIGFFSDYKNIKGTCSFSSGCSDNNIDREFNGGQAEIYGLESVARKSFQAKAFTFPLQLGYTYTVARFKDSFISGNDQWGEGVIFANDPLPYIPQHQLSFGSGVNYRKFSADANLTWKGQMADQSVSENRKIIPSFTTIDTAFSYQYSNRGKAYFRVNNILNNTYLVSYRPFGARSGASRTFSLGFGQRF